MSKIAYFKTPGKAKITIRSAGPELCDGHRTGTILEFVGVQISIVHDEDATKVVNFETGTDNTEIERS